MEGLRKATTNFSYDDRSSGRNMNPGPPKYKIKTANYTKVAFGGWLPISVFDICIDHRNWKVLGTSTQTEMQLNSSS
jgi:hypothetical protein